MRAARCEDTTQRVSECALFRGLYDLDALSRLPAADYSSAMRSSFDTRSRDAAPDTPDWFANRDFLTLEPGRTQVLFDEPGPGVITRIWSANPSGRVRVYLDDEAEPAIDAELRAWLDGDVTAGFAWSAAGGSNLYWPISFQKRCKITLDDAGRRLYYQIDFRRYATGVEVPRYARDGHADAVQALTSLATRFAPAPGWRAERTALRSDRPEGQRLPAADGGSVLRALRLSPATHDERALRETALDIWVDAEHTVHVPLGDFFGAGPGVTEVHALPVWTEPEGPRFGSRWPMPFARELRIALSRAHGEPVAAELELWSEPQQFDARSLLFHAQALSTGLEPNEPTHEYTLVHIRGDGLYVGTRLNVTNAEAAWWGEGDEKIWLDGEAFPSHFGTGTEDYFGYAYCSNQRFSLPYIGQPLAGSRQSYGRIALYRFHIADAIRFHGELRFDLEVNHWGSSGAPVAHDGIVYFYARPGAQAESPDRAPRTIPELPAASEPQDVPEGPYRCGGG